MLAEQVSDYHKRRKAERKNKLFHKTARQASRFFLDTSDASPDLGARNIRAITRANANIGTSVSDDLAATSQAFGFLGLALSAFYTIMIPALYFYYKVSGEPVPFTVTNNVRWAVSVTAVVLSVIGILVPPAALGICFAGAAIALIVNVIAMAKIIHARIFSTKLLVAAEDGINLIRLQRQWLQQKWINL